MRNFQKIFSDAKDASREVAKLSSAEKNLILKKLSQKLLEKIPEILAENVRDIQSFEKNSAIKNSDMIDRLLLTEERISGMSQDILKVVNLHDFVGEEMSEQKMDSGITIQKIRVPLGVIAMIYESRPNVTIDAGVLAFKSGNSIILKGGKEAEFSNQILAEIFQEVLSEFSEISGKNIQKAVQLLENASREDTSELLKAKGHIDLLIPRGGKGLIKFVSENSSVPVIETGASVVHTFVDESADFEMAKNIIINEKTRRVSVCNALDTLLIHEKISQKFLENIMSIEKEEFFDIKNPNKARALFGAFGRNKVMFHDINFSGSEPTSKNYEYITQKILEIDAFNNKASSGLAHVFDEYAKLPEENKVLIKKNLQNILKKKISDALFEVVSKILGSGE